jgi:hypothetical protein
LAFALNRDLIERIGATPDTVIRLVDGRVRSEEASTRSLRVPRSKAAIIRCRTCWSTRQWWPAAARRT